MWYILKLYCEAFGFFRCMVRKGKERQRKGLWFGLHAFYLGFKQNVLFLPFGYTEFLCKRICFINKWVLLFEKYSYKVRQHDEMENAPVQNQSVLIPNLVLTINQLCDRGQVTIFLGLTLSFLPGHSRDLVTEKGMREQKEVATITGLGSSVLAELQEKRKCGQQAYKALH